jgi:glycosyltransferase involved in cell wall biosynthesis
LPFEAVRLDFSPRAFNCRTVPARFRAAIEAWQPDTVVLSDGFFLKPWLGEALLRYPLVARYYAYEVACPRDMLLFKDGAPCPNNYLRTPNECRRCALARLGKSIRGGQTLAWTQEYIAARAYLPGYYDRLRRFLKRANAVIVYNSLMQSHLEGVSDRVLVFPGGVDAASYEGVPPAPKGPHERKIIAMAGRAEDPMKGFDTLIAAGECLAARRCDFEIHVTHPNPQLGRDWLKPTGWLDAEALRTFYTEADVCVTPSVWEEPFGLAAVEAMAAARPVCASRVGALQDIVRDQETGFLFERGDASALAQCLTRLLDDPALRQRMGAAGRRVAEQEYDWKRVIERHWPPLLEELAP